MVLRGCGEDRRAMGDGVGRVGERLWSRREAAIGSFLEEQCLQGGTCVRTLLVYLVRFCKIVSSAKRPRTGRSTKGPPGRSPH